MTGYLFDLDETLVTYEPSVPGIFRNACAAAGVEPTTTAAEAIGPAYVETFVEFEESPYVGAARAAVDGGLDVDPERFAETYIAAELDATHAPAGVPELLASLESVGVVTNGYGPVQRRKLEACGLDAHVDAVVCADDVEAFKPADPPFDAITDAIDASSYVMAGDNVDYDIRPAADRGYGTVLVGEADAAVDLADHRVADPAELDTVPVFERPANVD
jgi:FMN phosphatase YigB (HAD superfamily)